MQQRITAVYQLSVQRAAHVVSVYPSVLAAIAQVYYSSVASRTVEADCCDICTQLLLVHLAALYQSVAAVYSALSVRSEEILVLICSRVSVQQQKGQLLYTKILSVQPAGGMVAVYTRIVVQPVVENICVISAVSEDPEGNFY